MPSACCSEVSGLSDEVMERAHSGNRARKGVRYAFHSFSRNALSAVVRLRLPRAGYVLRRQARLLRALLGAARPVCPDKSTRAALGLLAVARQLARRDAGGRVDWPRAVRPRGRARGPRSASETELRRTACRDMSGRYAVPARQSSLTRIVYEGGAAGMISARKR